MIKLTRRRLLHLTAGPIALPITSQIAMAQNNPSPSHERPLAERLAAYAHALRYDDLDAATVERIKVHVIDTIGCGIGAFEEKAVRICREIALAVPGTATVIGTSRRTTPDLASFANGAAFRYLDFNDTYVGRFAVHPSDTIAACLAVAEAERANAQNLITAIALAYEVNSRLVDSLDIAARGWDPPVFSLPAVALAAGKLMKLDPERLTHAVGLAINVLQIPVPRMLHEVAEALGRSSLAIGLLVTGAGLHLEGLFRTSAAAALAVFLKLILMPAVAVGLALLFGLSGTNLAVVVCCTAVPTSSSGYVLARQMGGDAPLLAQIITLQTIFAALTTTRFASSASRPSRMNEALPSTNSSAPA